MMTKTDRFESFAAFQAEKLRLTAKRDLHLERIEQHWEALKHKEVRKDLANNAVHDLLGLWKPTRLLSSLLSHGSIATSVGLAFGSGKASLPKRAGLFALGLVAPKLLKRLNNLSMEDIVQELGVSVNHVRDHIRSRREARAAGPEVDVNEND